MVFLNREPVAEDMNKWDKVYYVGAKAEESGTISGQLIVDYWKAHPEADKNGDGKLQYVMLKGEPGHQDAELRALNIRFRLSRMPESKWKHWRKTRRCWTG